MPAGRVVMVELAEPVSTKTHKPGDTFAIRLAEPVVVSGQLVLRAGTTGIGEVVEASKPGPGRQVGQAGAGGALPHGPRRRGNPAEGPAAVGRREGPRDGRHRARHRRHRLHAPGLRRLRHPWRRRGLPPRHPGHRQTGRRGPR
ncbi:MAG: hypothetical protein WDN45_05505 [Caulobacteraceae bacterium]